MHAATIFFYWNIAVGAWLGCLLDCFSRCFFPSSLHGCVFINCIPLLGHGSLWAEERVAFPFMEFFFTFTTKHGPTAYPVAWFTDDSPQPWLRKQTCPTARGWTQHSSHLQHTFLGPIALVAAVLFFSQNPEVMKFFNQGIWTASLDKEDQKDQPWLCRKPSIK